MLHFWHAVVSLTQTKCSEQSPASVGLLHLMPYAAPTPCRQPGGCGELVRDGTGFCEAHRKLRQKAQDAERGSSAARGYDSKWQKARVGFLRLHPLCAQCERDGLVTEANEVDHIIPHKGDRALFWNRDNWQSLCKPCHGRKTAIDDGGFGRQRVRRLH